MPKGVYLRKPRAAKIYNPALVARVAELYAAGATQSEVAATLKLSQKVVFTVMQRHGIAARVAAKRDQFGERNHAWKGEDAGYQAFHRRLYSRFGRPVKCSSCGTEEAGAFDYANLTGNYADLTDYAPMCRSCHWRFDERTGGFKTVAFCEIKPRSQRVLAKHWPDVPCWPDVTTYAFKEGEADVVVGGFPCQDISDQGLRAGLAGARSGLWSEMVRAFRVVRPLYGIVENVAALLERGMGRVLGDLAALGHDAEWHCIPAGYIGAPHERDRLWITTNAASEPGLHEPDVGEAAERLRHDLDTWRANPWDEARSRVCRVEDGLPDRVDRTEQLGLAVVPQIPELIGRAILSAIAGEARSGETVEQGSTGTASTRARKGIAHNPIGTS